MGRRNTYTPFISRKDEYLNSQSVKGLIRYICEIQNNHGLNHSYEVKFPRWKSHLDSSIGKTGKDKKVHVGFKDLSEALAHYYWPTSGGESEDDDEQNDTTASLSDFESNETILLSLSKELQSAIYEDNDLNRTFLLSIKILDWGGVFRGSGKWLIERAENGSLIADLKEGVSILDGSSWTSDNGFINGKLRMDSGLTKVYALASKHSVIYDDRVGAALGLLSRKYLESCNPEHSRVPPELCFMRSNKASRNPSSKEYKFPCRAKNYPYHAQSNLMANWLIQRLTECLGPNWSNRKVEAALFMIGYCVA